MTPASAEKQVENGSLAQVTQVTSDLACFKNDLRKGKRKSLATCVSASAPLSQEREREEEGGVKTLPLSSLSSTLPLPPEKSRALAAYAGSISRWCDLTGNVPEVSLDQDKIAAEFAAFNHHLDELASEARRIKSLQF